MARPTLYSHPKFALLSRRLGSRALAAGSLELIWQAAYQSGDPRLGSADAVEAVADWQGEPGVLCAALLEARFVDDLGEGNVSIHDLEDHAPDYVAKRRKREAERVEKGTTLREVRQRAALASHAARGHANGVQTAASGVQTAANGRPPSPSPSHTPRSGSESLEPDRRRSASKQAAPAVFGLVWETAGKGPGTWWVSEEQLEEWRPLFPGCDVLGELRKALAWSKANPAKRKTYSGMPRFLVQWLSRAQDQAKGSLPPGASAPKAAKAFPANCDWHQTRAAFDRPAHRPIDTCPECRVHSRIAKRAREKPNEAGEPMAIGEVLR